MKYKWTKEKCQEEALKYHRRSDFQAGSHGAYESARRHDWLSEICLHMDPYREDWTEDSVQLEAQKYKSKTDFKKESGSAYNYARNRLILNKICSHMKSCYKYWTPNRVKQEALNYKTRSDFQDKSPSAYQFARNNGLLDHICVNMPILSAVSSKEKALLFKIKEKFNSAKTLRKTKIHIDSSPNIHRLDIDIFVPELNKGIEFDGKYWHSSEGLERSHPTWNQQDLHHYHQIKDGYFKSQGIEILHIKEEDWDTNPEVCLEQCFSFLRG